MKLLPCQFVKPYVKSKKNNRADAEAMSQPPLRIVVVKSLAQQDMQAAHRIRKSLLDRHTANQIRPRVSEYGLIAPVGIRGLRRAIPDWLEDAENGLTDACRALLGRPDG